MKRSHFKVLAKKPKLKGMKVYLFQRETGERVEDVLINGNNAGESDAETARKMNSMMSNSGIQEAERVITPGHIRYWRVAMGLESSYHGPGGMKMKEGK